MGELVLINFCLAFLKSLLQKPVTYKFFWSLGKCSLVRRESRWNGFREIALIDRT